LVFVGLKARLPVRLYGHNAVAVLLFPATVGYPRLTRPVIAELSDLLDEVELSGVFHGVVIAANERSFATGAELEEVLAVEGVAAREFARLGQALCNRVAHFPSPVVAAIRGFCLGGGLDLALACHARVAAYDASFGHPGASLGLMTGWGGTERLPRLVGKSAALQILLTADRLPATQAFTLGLVDELVPSKDLIEAAAKRAELMSARRSGPAFPPSA
jgi:enoyl-CoA hydratase/carnithine racemase